MSTTYMRVRITSESENPASRKAVSATPNASSVCSYASPTWATSPFTVAVQPGEDIKQLAAIFGPTPRSQGGPSYVETDGNPVPKACDRLGTPLWVLQGRRTEVDPLTARRQRGLQRGVVPDST